MSNMTYCSTIQEGSLVIDSSTIDPMVAKSMAEKAAAKQSVYMDAPVSGGVYIPATGAGSTHLVQILVTEFS